MKISVPMYVWGAHKNGFSMDSLMKFLQLMK